jgi:hypothetical protein
MSPSILTEHPSVVSATRTRRLEELLVELHDLLREAHDQADANDAGSLLQDYLYLEAELADACDSEIDLSFHDGRAFIRIAR